MAEYYVYQLRVDGEDLPFYVGKGKGKRAESSSKERSVNTYKANYIKKAKVDGKEIIVEYIDVEMSECDAFAMERFIISLYGRRKEDTGCLTNLTDGGDGCSGYKHTDKAKYMIGSGNRGKVGPLFHRYGKPGTWKGITGDKHPRFGKPGSMAWRIGEKHHMYGRHDVNLGEKNGMFGTPPWKTSAGKRVIKYWANADLALEVWNDLDRPGCKRLKNALRKLPEFADIGEQVCVSMIKKFKNNWNPLSDDIWIGDFI